MIAEVNEGMRSWSHDDTAESGQNLKSAPADQPDWSLRSHVQKGRMLINSGSRLGAAIALCAVEIQCGHAMLAVRTFEGGPAVQRFGGVISHVFIVVLQPGESLGQEVCNLRVGP
jgi:hypothetical protein